MACFSAVAAAAAASVPLPEDEELAEDTGAVKSGFQAKVYLGLSAEVIEVGPFLKRDLDKEEPPSVSASKLRKRLCELRGPMYADLLKEGEDKPLASDVLCELGKIATSESQGVGFRLLPKALPDNIVVSASIGGDEGCARVWAQDVHVVGHSYATMKEAKAAHFGQRKQISLKAIKRDPIALAEVTDHVFVLLKVETDEGRPQAPYAQWGRKAFVDKESAAQNARKLFKKCIWDKDSASSGDGEGQTTAARTRADESGSENGEDAFKNNSDCGDFTEDISKMEDDMVMFDYCTSVRINKVMLPMPAAPSSAQAPTLTAAEQAGVLVGLWKSQKGKGRILKENPTSARLAYAERMEDGSRLYGILEEVKGADLLLQATLRILEPGEDLSTFLSTLESLESVGRIRVRLLNAGGIVAGRATKAVMETQIHVDAGAEEDWEAPERFTRSVKEKGLEDDSAEDDDNIFG